MKIYPNDDLGKLILRISCGGILFFHGWHKVFVEIDHVKKIVSDAGLPEFTAYGNLLAEFAAPILLIIGFRTRIAALVIVINMLFSVLLTHRDIAFSVNQFGGWMIETNILYLTMALSVFFLGAGEYSLSKGQGNWR